MLDSTLTMLGEHYKAISQFLGQERKLAQYYQKPLIWNERNANEFEREAVSHLIYEMLEDCAVHDPNIVNHTTELRERLLERGGLSTELKLYWGKRGFTSEEKYFVQANAFAKVDVPVEEVPLEVVEKDFHRTPRIDITSTAVKMNYSPQSVQLVFPEQHLLVKASEESYPTALVRERPTIIYPALARVLAYAVHTEMTWRRGFNYWRPTR